MKRIDYNKGDVIGDCFYYRELPVHISYNGRRFRRAEFICGYCGNIFAALIMNVKGGNVKSCGCLVTLANINKNTTHGLTNSVLYSTWKNIKQRCFNPQSQDYVYYGSRGITMCTVWKNDFKAFHDYVAKLPHYGEPGMTLDRIDNDGNYEPCNVRWVDMKTQRANQRKKL